MQFQGMEIDEANLERSELETIIRLLSRSMHAPPELEDIWMILDHVWHELNCDNRNFNSEKISYYYQHPAWLLNGFFVEQDLASKQHRQTISEWIAEKSEIQTVLDYGGGFGTLARLIADQKEILSVEIYEPHPHSIALAKAEKYANVRFVTALKQQYDCVVSTDVLEHVPDPLLLFSEMIQRAKLNGYLIIGHCFHPVIQCHLPATFHLRHTFDRFAKLMGLAVIGCCVENYVTVYQKQREQTFDWQKIRRSEQLSKLLFPLTELRLKVIGKVRKVWRERFTP